MNLEYVKANSIDDIWEDVLPLVKKAIKAGSDRFHPEDVRSALKEGKHQLWLVYEDGLQGMWITSISKTRFSKALEVRWLAGVKDDSNAIERYWNLFQGMELYAQHEGCDRIYVYGRKGWARKMPGYKETHVVMERRIAPSIERTTN